jgi:hypothetical protein
LIVGSRYSYPSGTFLILRPNLDMMSNKR